MAELSANAIKLLKHFQDNKLRVAAYEYSKSIRDLFSDSAAASAAQQELEVAGLLALGKVRPSHEPSGVRASALTREGAQYLADHPL